MSSVRREAASSAVDLALCISKQLGKIGEGWIMTGAWPDEPHWSQWRQRGETSQMVPLPRERGVSTGYDTRLDCFTLELETGGR